jgi:hypothetical protein
MVALLMPAKHILDTKSPHLAIMLVKEYWFREFYLGLKVTASFDRNESHQRTIDGQIKQQPMCTPLAPIRKKSSTKQLAPTGPILGPENLLKTGFAQKGFPSI